MTDICFHPLDLVILLYFAKDVFHADGIVGIEFRDGRRADLIIGYNFIVEVSEIFAHRKLRSYLSLAFIPVQDIWKSLEFQYIALSLDILSRFSLNTAYGTSFIHASRLIYNGMRLYTS